MGHNDDGTLAGGCPITGAAAAGQPELGLPVIFREGPDHGGVEIAILKQEKRGLNCLSFIIDKYEISKVQLSKGSS